MTQEFRFRRHMDIGSIEAETDRMLQESFVDTGYLDRLRDTGAPKSVIVGRTGTGKSALLLRLERSDAKTLRIAPEALSLQFLSNSTVVPYLTEIDVHLELFYKLLWEHTLVVELLRDHYDLKSKTKQDNFLVRFRDLFQTRDQDKASALRYLEEWGDEFWKEPESRVRQVTEELSNRIDAEIGGSVGPLRGSVGGGGSGSTRVTEEIRRKAQEIVNQIQIKRLHDAKRIIQEDVLDDPQNPYYILIDDLDKNWIDQRFAYDLIAALIEVAGEFAKMKNIKVLVALREDVVARIQERRTTKRQQREKQEVLFLRLHWTPDQLHNLLDSRIRTLVRGQYGQDLGLKEILPGRKIKGIDASTYLLDRSFLRPRDLIAYLNYAIQEAVNKEGITWSILWNVEGRYSRSRLRALEDEWNENYPGIKALFEIFRGFPDGFEMSDVSDNDVLVPLERARGQGPEDSVVDGLYARWGDVSGTEVCRAIVEMLFKVGVFGVALTRSQQPQFVYETRDLLQLGLPEEAMIYFHPSLYQALYVKDGRRDNS